MLTNPDKLNLTWIGNFAGGQLPEVGAVVGGFEKSNNRFYIGRLGLDGFSNSRIFGKVGPNSKPIARYIIRSGRSVNERWALPSYEVLTVQ